MKTNKVYYDKNGVEITDGCIIYNEWDKDKYHKIIKNEKGELCFASDMTVLDERYGTDRFWEIVKQTGELKGNNIMCQDKIDTIKLLELNFTKANILLSEGNPKQVQVTNISFKNEKLFSVTVKYPLDKDYHQYLTYYFDGRKLGESKDIDVNEIFKGFCINENLFEGKHQ